MLEYRLNAYMQVRDGRTWLYKCILWKTKLPRCYLLLCPKQKPVLDSLDDLDPEMKEHLTVRISLEETKDLNVAVDIVMDSVR